MNRNLRSRRSRVKSRVRSRTQRIMPRRSPLLLALLLFAFTARAEFPVTEERALAPLLGFSPDVRVEATHSGFLAFWATARRTGSKGVGADRAVLARAASHSNGAIPHGGLPLPLNGTDRCLERRAVPPGGSDDWGESTRRSHDRAVHVRLGDYVGNTLSLSPFPQPVAPVLASDGEDFLVTFTLSQRTKQAAFAQSPPRTARRRRADRPRRVGTGLAVDIRRRDRLDLLRRLVVSPWMLTSWRGSPTRATSKQTVPLAPPVRGSPRCGSRARATRILVVRGVTPLRGERADDARGRDPLRRRSAQLTGWFPLWGDATAMPRVSPTDEGWIVRSVRSGWEHAAGDPPSPATDRSAHTRSVPHVPGISSVLMDAAGARLGDRAALVWTTIRRSRQRTPRVPIQRGADCHRGRRRHARPGPRDHFSRPRPADSPVGGACPATSVSLVAWVERTLEERFVVQSRGFDGDASPLGAAVTMPSRAEWGSDSIRPSHPTALPSSSSGRRASGGWGIYGARVAAEGRCSTRRGSGLRCRPAFVVEVRTADVDWSGSASVVASSNGEADRCEARLARRLVLDVTAHAISTMREYGSRWIRSRRRMQRSRMPRRVARPPGRLGGCQIPCPVPPPTIRAAIVTADLRSGVAAPQTEPWEEPWSDFRSLDASWNDIADAWLVAWSLRGPRRVARDGALLGTRDALGYGGSTSSCRNARGGGRWAPYRRPDLFHGWTATERSRPSGNVRCSRLRRAVGPRAVDAPRPSRSFCARARSRPARRKSCSLPRRVARSGDRESRSGGDAPL